MDKLNEEDLKRKSIIEKYIEHRTSLDENTSIQELNEVSEIINQVNNFIDGYLDLSSGEIETKIQRLISHFTINLIYSLDSNIAFRRARKFDKTDSKRA